jgi:3',5'-nucleoside bisphosphate phosphatase
LIDLHSHTTESDGTFTPAELIEAATAARLEALAITDHDTFAGYDAAVPLAAAAGLELICGIELSVKWQGHTVHLLAYFLNGGAPEAFRQWVSAMLDSREDRNRRLESALQAHGVDITLEEVHRRAGPLAGRPHFAALLIEKGYATSIQHAFDAYLGENAPFYVSRDEPNFTEAARQVRQHGGISSVAHPGRTWTRREAAAEHIGAMRSSGLHAIEVWHSDHSPEDMRFYESLAVDHGLGVTGGSDFHGANKPTIALGTGREGRLNVPRDVLDRLQQIQ